METNNNVFEGKPKYNHHIKCVEYTKLLEREQCDTLAFLRKLARQFPPKAQKVTPTYETDNSDGVSIGVKEKTGSGFYAPEVIGSSLVLPNAEIIFEPSAFNYYPGWNTWKVKVTTTNGTIYDGETPYTLKFTDAGIYTITYYGQVNVAGTINPWGVTITYNISAVPAEGYPAQPKFTITDVVNRILKYGTTRRAGIDPQRFVFNKEQAARFSTKIAPAFFIERRTMYEALMEVGNYIHGIPRLLFPTPELKAEYGQNIDGVVQFDMLGGGEVIRVKGELIARKERTHGDQYCGAFDSIVENALNTTDLAQGATKFPFGGGLETVRAASGVKIDNDTACFGPFPQSTYEVTKLYLKWKDLPEVDATSFLYEKQEYDALSTFKGEPYPYTIAYALYYTQYGNTIEGLNAKVEGSSSADSAWQTPAIYNILNALYGAGTVDIKEPLAANKNLSCRVEYTTPMSVRVKQYKPYTGISEKNSLIFQQSGTQAEMSYYGQFMRGRIARSGNSDLMLTYRIVSLKDIPKCGQIIPVDRLRRDGTEYEELMYIAVVSVRTYKLYNIVTLTCTAEFNKIYEYYAVDSHKRYAEVSKDYSRVRYMNYSEKVTVGDEEPTRNSMITSKGVSVFADTLYQPSNDQQAAAVLAQGVDENGATSLYNKVAMPCSSYACGNSVAFSYNYVDNFGAGWQSKETPSNDGAGVRLRTKVSYCDEYGEMPRLNLDIGRSIATRYYDKDLLPACPEGRMNNTYFTTGNNPFEVGKNSGEEINFTYQLHTQANRKSVVVGAELNDKNALVTVTDPKNKPVVVLVPYLLNALAFDIDLSEAARIDVNVDSLISVDSKNKKITIAPITNTTDKSYVAWALINPDNNKLYVGENIELPPNGQSKPIYFNF